MTTRDFGTYDQVPFEYLNGGYVALFTTDQGDWNNYLANCGWTNADYIAQRDAQLAAIAAATPAPTPAPTDAPTPAPTDAPTPAPTTPAPTDPATGD